MAKFKCKMMVGSGICLLIAIIVVNGDPMMKSVEKDKKQSLPPGAFWPYLLQHPTRSRQNGQEKSQEREDYYDAVRDEDDATSSSAPITSSKTTNDRHKGSSRTTATSKETEAKEETAQMQQMMALLLANVDPVPMFTATGTQPKVPELPTPTTTITTVVMPKNVHTQTKTTLSSMFKVDAETYDDERAEAGKDDEDETAEADEDDDDDAAAAAADKLMAKELKKQHHNDGAWDGTGIREMDAEADGIGQMPPSKGTVDGQTHFRVDGETGTSSKMANVVMPSVDGEVVAKRNFPTPPEAEIIRMGQ